MIYMDPGRIAEKLGALTETVEMLLLVELCKAGATRKQARKVLGSLDDHTYAKVNAVFGNKKGIHHELEE